VPRLLQVYDITSWVSRHPGGELPLLAVAGNDATDVFRAMHPASGTDLTPAFLLPWHRPAQAGTGWRRPAQAGTGWPAPIPLPVSRIYRAVHWVRSRPSGCCRCCSVHSVLLILAFSPFIIKLPGRCWRLTVLQTWSMLHPFFVGRLEDTPLAGLPVSGLRRWGGGSGPGVEQQGFGHDCRLP